MVRALLVDQVLSNGDDEGGASGGGPAELDVGTEVQVSIQADAVTLYRPANAPDDGATSARNRLSGCVIEPGADVVASFKTTATRATAIDY